MCIFAQNLVLLLMFNEEIKQTFFSLSRFRKGFNHDRKEGCFQPIKEYIII